MRVLVIVPKKFLQKSEPGPYYCYSYFLDDPEYLHFFQERGSNTILDFSPALPRRVSEDSLIYGTKLVKPKLVVLPSIDYSCEKTVTVASRLIRRIPKSNLVGVIQGYDIESMRVCYQFLRNYCEVIGLPSTAEKIAKRDEIARDLDIKEKLIYIEVFYNPYEEVPPARSFGICTSYPARLAQDLRKLEEFKPTPRRLNFDVSKDAMIEPLLDWNIERYREAVDK